MRILVAAIILLFASMIPAQEKSEWSVPTKNRDLQFPHDHGSHPDFKIEWWYLTGHLFDGERRFGFQATFFRLGQRPVDVAKNDFFGESQIYMAHMALSDAETETFLHETRFNRGGWDARAKVGELDVRNGNWTLKSTEDGMSLDGSIDAESAFSLTLRPEQPHVIFGEDGISRKGPEGTAASYYITYPRLSAEGELRIGERTFSVEGEAWMDHEISSSQLDRNQVGWDWVSIQFFDGRELMGFILREKDGKLSEYSTIVWVGEWGKLTHLSPDRFKWDSGKTWTSPTTDAAYPVSPTITTFDPKSGENMELRIVPVFDHQEVTGGAGEVSYWEGACDVIDGEGETIGRAYLELTGYADNIAENLR